MYFKKLNYNLQLYVASKVLKKSKEYLMINKFDVNESMEKIAYDYLINNKPLSKIFKVKPFWKNEFFTNKYTLDPRPETEALIELILSHNHFNVTVVDLGVGTGAILLTLMKELKNIKGIGIDISEEALKVCKKNAKRMKLNPTLKCMDLQDFDEEASILVSNPPYLTKNEINDNFQVLKYDPFLALYGGEDGLEVYRKILNVIKKGKFTHIYLEVPENKLFEVKKIFKNISNIYFVS